MVREPALQAGEGGRARRLGAQLRAELRLATRPPSEDDEPGRDGVREVGAVVLVDEGQEQVHAGRHAHGRPPVAVPHVDPVGLQVEVGVAVGERRRRGPVRGRLVAVEQSGGGEEPRTGAHRRDAPGARRQGREVVDERAVAAGRPRPVAAHDDEGVDRLGAGGGRVQQDVARDEDAALGADPTPRRRHPGGVRRVGAEPGGAAEHLDGTGEVEELEVVEGHEQHLVRRTHPRIIRARCPGSKSKYLTIPATGGSSGGDRAILAGRGRRPGRGDRWV